MARAASSPFNFNAKANEMGLGMSIQTKVEQDLKQSMMAKDGVKTSALRFLKSALKYAAIEKKLDIVSDADAFVVIQKQIKQRRESIDQFTKAGRQDLADIEIGEVKVFELYMPAQMPQAEIEAAVKAAVQETGAVSKKDFGRVMKFLTERLAGKADSKKISEILGKILI